MGFRVGFSATRTLFFLSLKHEIIPSLLPLTVHDLCIFASLLCLFEGGLYLRGPLLKKIVALRGFYSRGGASNNHSITVCCGKVLIFNKVLLPGFFYLFNPTLSLIDELSYCILLFAFLARFRPPYQPSPPPGMMPSVSIKQTFFVVMFVFNSHIQ